MKASRKATDPAVCNIAERALLLYSASKVSRDAALMAIAAWEPVARRVVTSEVIPDLETATSAVTTAYAR